MSFEINRGNNNCISQAGVAYVIIPKECDVAEYVQRCYRNNSLSIGGGMGATAMHNVKVVDDVLDKIKFPSNSSTQGSMVVWIKESFYNKPLIIGTISEGGKSSNLLSNGQQRIYQEVTERIAEVFLDALNSRVLITALGDLSKPSEVIIKASSRNAQGDVVKVESKDVVKVEGQSYKLNLTKDFEITINNGLIDENKQKKDILKIIADKDKLTLIDHYGNNVIFDKDKCEFIDQWNNRIISNEEEIHLVDSHENEFLLNKEHIQFICQKFDLGKGNEQMVLGNTLVNLLGQLIDAICNLTVITHAGASGTPINAASFTIIKNKLNSILSKLSNTD